MKKILIFLMSMFMLASTCIIASADESEPCEELLFLEKLGVIYQSVDKPDSVVTRENFALYLARMLGVEKSADENVRYFIDVESGSYAERSINSLLEMGIISVSENEKFRPQDKITPEECYKMIICALGYGKYAEFLGSGMNKYITVAEQIGIDDALKNYSHVTVNDAARLLVSAGETNTYVLSGTGYKVDDEETLFSKYRDICAYEGTVTSVYGGSLYGEAVAKNGEMTVGEIHIKGVENTDFSEFLGDYVKVYYIETDFEDEGELLHIFHYGRVESITYDIKYHKEYRDGRCVWYTNDNHTKTDGETLKNPIVLYNGTPLKSGEADIFKSLNKGTISLKDSDDDGKFDVLAITDYKNFVVGHKDAENQKLYSAINSNDILAMENYDSIKIMSSDGEVLTFDDILAGQVLAVSESFDKKCIKIIACNTEIKGTLDSYDEADGFITIDGKTYEMEKSYAKSKSIPDISMLLGEKLLFRTDNFGNIAWIELDGSELLNTGLLLFIFTDEDNDEVCLKIVTSDNQVKVYRLRERVVCDGRYTLSENVNFVLENNADDIRQLIRYRLDVDEKIAEIDTINFDSEKETANNSMTPGFEEPGKKRWFNSARLDALVMMDSNTKVFYLPYGSKDADEEDYFVGDYAVAMFSDFQYYADAYYFNEDNFVCDAVVCYYEYSSLPENLGRNKTPVMIKRVYKAIDDDGESAMFIEGFKGASSVKYKVPESVDVSGFEAGDLVTFNFDIKGNIADKKKSGLDSVTVLFKASEKVPSWNKNTQKPWMYQESVEYYAYYRGDMQLSFGYVTDISEKYIKWDGNGDGKFDETALISGKAVIFDSEKRNLSEQVYVGNIDEIISMKMAGDECSRVIYHTTGGAGRNWYVYK